LSGFSGSHSDPTAIIAAETPDHGDARVKPLENPLAPPEAFADAAATAPDKDTADRNGPPSMGSGNFADMLACVPGAFLRLHHCNPETLPGPETRLDMTLMPPALRFSHDFSGSR
jgi:metal-dependent amidase/aminoacylase/carboxypeptidase family protein